MRPLYIAARKLEYITIAAWLSLRSFYQNNGDQSDHMNWVSY